jgi:circadian clock protein KaiC
VGSEGVVTGSARLAQEAKDKAASLIREQEMQRRGRELERKRREIRAQIEILKVQLESETAEEGLLNREDTAREDQLAADRVAMGVSRQTEAKPGTPAARSTSKPKK